MTRNTGLSERFEKTLDGFAKNYNGNVEDRHRLLKAFIWLYDQGERASSDEVANYLEDRGRDEKWATNVGEWWENAVILLDIRAGKLEAGFRPLE